MANALKAINTRVNALQKKHPKTKRTTLQKQAGREWKAGKLSGAKKKRKPAAKKTTRRKTAKRKTVRVSVRTVGARPRKRTHAKRRTRRVGHKPGNFIVVDDQGNKRKLKYAVVGKRKKPAKRKRYKPVKVTHCRRVGAKKGINPLILLAGGGLLLYALTRPGVLSPSLPPVTITNPQAAASANNLVAYASAAGMAIPSIIKLINSLNAAPPATVVQAGNAVASGSAPISNFFDLSGD